MSSLKQKAKTLSDLFWENELEWNKWLRMGVTESKQVALAPKYQEKWVRLEDVKEACEKCDYREVVRIRKEEARELKQKLQQLRDEIIGYVDDFDVVSFLEKNDITYDSSWLKYKLYELIGGFRTELIMRFSKFEELLKEEKEA